MGPREPRRREEHRRHYFACEQKYGIEVVGKKIYAEQNGLNYDVFRRWFKEKATTMP